MRFDTLDAWLEWQSRLNPAEIELGLERSALVLEHLGLSPQFECPLIMVAGTNGKGSVVAMLESIALAEGLSVACYTSPHIKYYNERISINAQDVSDELLCETFERIDQARGDVQLTYFEFGTLAAIDLFHRTPLDIIIMEVGLGGRLDAVNIMQPDISVVTTIDIDHSDWLGDNRESIGYEKAGIFRADTPVVCGDANPPASLLQFADNLQAKCYISGDAFFAEQGESHWNFRSQNQCINQLPMPSLKGGFQLQNAAVAIMALQLLSKSFKLSERSIIEGLSQIRLNGRYQLIHHNPDVYVDVAHNVQAAKSLASQLSETENQYRSTHAIIAMLADKEVGAVIEQVSPVVDFWHCAGLDSVQRGMSVKRLVSKFEQVNAGVKLRAESTVTQACDSVMRDVKADERIIVFGSFYTVSEAMSYFEHLE